MLEKFAEFEALDLRRTMLADRFRLRRRLASLRRDEADGRGDAERWRRWRDDACASIARRDARQANVPALSYNESLPIAERRWEIAAAITAHPVVVVCGETGSGKSTQIPKICLELGRGIDGMIGHTQPRRIAARSIAARIADELACPLGTKVGYKIRFSDATRPETLVKIMTDGILLAETQQDRFLEQYDTLIIDEAHERSLNIDFLLGLLTRLLPKRPELKVIITSATIDAARFAEHFARHLPRPGDAAERRPVPVIEVTGRMFPVEIRYQPPIVAVDPRDQVEPDMPRAIAGALTELNSLPRGDVLIFLPTERDIHETVQVLRGSPVVDANTELLPLYARLSPREQQRVFQPHSGRRFVLATNVAESSLTVPGVRYVIDTGLARVSRFVARSKVQRLPIEPISRASADQRAGRCGRVAPGVCIRLFSEDDYQSRDRYSTPEIRRTNLAAAVLQTKVLRLGPLESLPLLDPPHADMVRDGYQTLFELGALDASGAVTDVGRSLARLPVDPRIGRMILAGMAEGCLAEVLVIAAALEVYDPRERPLDRRDEADAAHRPFTDSRSDFLGQLKLWEFYQTQKAELPRGQWRKVCQEHFLSYNRMREWSDIHRQLRQLVGRHLDSSRADAEPVAGPRADSASHLESAYTSKQRYAAIHRAILTGLLSGVAWRSDAFEYTGAGGVKFNLWPGSGPFRDKPGWIVAAEFVETGRRYARIVASIDPRWIEPLAPHLVERSYSDPHWVKAAGAALVTERVTLFGLPIAKRRVPLGPIDPATARDLLIREGLVGGDLALNAAFFRHNQQLREELARQAAKSRRGDLVVDQRTCRDFYEARIPSDVHDVASLHRWRHRAERDSPRRLFMTREDLVGGRPSVDEAGFPEQLAVNELRLPVKYRFEPGMDDDGTTLVVPREALTQVNANHLDWLVPGQLLEKVERLIRSLPKSLRRELPPAEEAAKRIVERLRFGEGPFLATVAATLSDIARRTIEPEQFQLDKLPHYLFMNVHVVGPNGQLLARGRDFRQLCQRLGVRPAPVQEIAEPGWSSDGHVDWDWRELPTEIEVRRAGVTLPAFPTLVDRGNSVSLRLLDSRDVAAHWLRAGVRRLFLLAEGEAAREHVAWMPRLAEWTQSLADRYSVQQLHEELAELIADRAIFGDGPVPRTKDEYDARIAAGRAGLETAVVEVVRVVGGIVDSYQSLRDALAAFPVASALDTVCDVRRHVDRLLIRRFLTETPWRWLEQIPRFLDGDRVRLQRLAGNAVRDREASREMASLETILDKRAKAHEAVGRRDPELQLYRWMLEEYRVSLFAQVLGTSLTISPQRLQRQWEKVHS